MPSTKSRWFKLHEWQKLTCVMRLLSRCSIKLQISDTHYKFPTQFRQTVARFQQRTLRVMTVSILPLNFLEIEIIRSLFS